MRHWWVNQNQTFRQEIDGGYLWSPKRNKNGHRNPFYEFMREVAPGDVVFSFCDTRGQGLFRDNVRAVERACRITHVERMEHLVASHVQPWRDSSNEQRLDGENGLLLTPTVDHLFDKGFISFEDSGQLIVSPVADQRSLNRMGVDTERRVNVGAFSEGQRRYLDFHRENVLRMARGLATR
jgi:hypothetical protein